MDISKAEKIKTKRKSFNLVFIVAVAMLATIAGVTNTILQNRISTYSQFNEQIKGVAKFSTGYLTKNFDLYLSTTYKYRQIVDDFLKDNSQIGKFQIIDAEGQILFDSENQDGQLGNAPKEVVDLSRKNEVSNISEGQKIKEVISPYFEEWGTHKYSVLFYPDYTSPNKAYIRFSIEVIITGSLVLILVIVVIYSFVLKEESKIQKEEGDRLEFLDKQRQGFMVLVAHNLRTPLTNIIGFSSILRETKLTAKQDESLKVIEQNAGNLEGLVENVLAITDVLGDPDAPVFKETVAVETLIDEVMEKYKKRIDELDLDVEIAIRSHNLSVLANKRYARMIIEAIVDNAIKFNKRGGFIKIEATAEKSFAKISVSDNGVGIAKADASKVYDIFHKANAENILVENFDGTGIGLFMAKLLIEFMNGSIDYKGNKEGGATFTLNFKAPPVSKEQKITALIIGEK